MTAAAVSKSQKDGLKWVRVSEHGPTQQDKDRSLQRSRRRRRAVMDELFSALQLLHTKSAPQTAIYLQHVPNTAAPPPRPGSVHTHLYTPINNLVLIKPVSEAVNSLSVCSRLL